MDNKFYSPTADELLKGLRIVELEERLEAVRISTVETDIDIGFKCGLSEAEEPEPIR